MIMTPGAYFCVRVIDLLPTHIKMSLDFSQINSNLKKKMKKKISPQIFKCSHLRLCCIAEEK